MLPIRLELRNFLAYRTPDPIFFEGMHLACLSGANGAGKSSILDGITWAIWGKARSRSDDDLIHIGQEEMSVTLDFVQNDLRYRIIRKRRLGKQRKAGGRSPGTTMLDLFGWVDEENTYRLISQSSIRQTQSKIIELVGLDYETFVNSAFLQQGRADAFTVQTSAHRKRILAEILNLELWASYENLAKEQLRAINGELSAISVRLQEMEQEIAQEPMIQHEFELANEELERVREQVAQAEARYLEMRGAESELRSAKSELKQLRFQINDRHRDIEKTQVEIERLEQRLADYQATISQRENIEEGYARLVEAREADQALGDALRELREVEQMINEVQRQISQEQAKIEHDITSSETLIADSQHQVAVIEDLNQQIAEIDGDIVLLEQDEKRREILLREITALKEEEARLSTHNEMLRTEMNTIKQRLDLVYEVTEASCPLCGQPLDEEHREQLLDDLQTQGTERGDHFRANRDRIKQVQEELTEREQSVRILAQRLSDLAPLQAELGKLRQQLQDAESARLRTEELQEQVQNLREVIDNKAFARELHTQLEELQQNQAALTYDPETHSAIREKMSTFEVYQKQTTALEVALQSVPDVEQSLEDALARAERWQKSLVELEAQATEVEAGLEALEAQVKEMQRREMEWNHQRTVERQALEKRTSLKQRLVSIDNQRIQYGRYQERQKYLQEQQGIYEQLRNAFSKNGIPAMVIEAAIPELEEATNHLLRRMTSGRLVVRFDTQREKKTGGVAETFDIWISDELGTRDYSLYSGGEAFRVNFAIRVAISQLLARRAGATLRTLFIDEGFGTQDAEGRDRLVEAITAIQDDFDLVLVITHIDELRDAFPVRIEVDKLSDGSRVRLI